MASKNVVVVGAGVAGLTTALLLSREPGYNITVAAKHMPGDYDIEYASPWAGANFMPVSIGGTEAAKWDKETWYALEELARNNPEAGIHFQGLRVYNRKKDVGTVTADWLAELVSPNPWWRTLFKDYRSLPKSELAPNVDNGHSCTSVCINTAIYLAWLVGQCIKNGVQFKRAIFSHLTEAVDVHHSGRKADIILNCTGLAARWMGGVCDENVYPARGQIILVRNTCDSMYSVSGTDDGLDEAMYIMGRAGGGGTILGGCYQKNNWESQPDPNLALRIMKRCVDVCPALTDGKGIEHLDVIRHGVGLRPVREGGARIEREKLNGVHVVHNYGHGGAGYQCSYGCARAAVDLVRQCASERVARL